MTRDYRDLVIEMATDAEVLLVESLVRLKADRDAYRMLAQQAVQALHDRTRDLEALREQHHRLVDEYRHLRGQVMRQAEAA